mmetsp:Transcript_19939/g.61904  ORF Transcript_19939/g.61904 Transcript_19939/m.61904 type:complete len:150 (+) Transcript_19939:2480-2929(+)
MLRCGLLLEAAAPARADALAVISRVQLARLSKRDRKRNRTGRDPPRRRPTRAMPARPEMLRVAGCNPVKIAADGTCGKDDLVALIVEMSQKSASESAKPFLETLHDLQPHTVDGRVPAEFATQRLRELVRAVDYRSAQRPGSIRPGPGQ